MKKMVNLYCDLLIHDFGTILQNIQSSLELSSNLLNKPDKMRKYLNIIEKQVIRGTQLISNVINIYKVDNFENSLQQIDLLKVLKTSIKYIESLFQNHNIKIELNYSIIDNLSFDGFYIQADKFLKNVFENIIFNAIYHNINPTIQISINITKEELNKIQFFKLEFIDNGVGITDKRKKTIFHESNQIHKKKKGMGFGLSLVKKLLNKYNGNIWVEDNVKGQLNKGSKFVIMIPEICEKPFILT